LEGTNEGYAIAKIAGIKLCESLNRQHGTDYRSVMPTNLYGPGDNFHEENSHVIPALLMRFHEARLNGLDSVHVWGSGRPKREFLHVDDLAAACVHVMNIDNRDYSRVTDTRCSHINIGTGIDCSIKELVEELCKVTGYSGEVIYDTTKPDGTPRKLLDISRIRSLGWKPSVSLSRGLTDTYTWYLANYGKTRSH
jgi:GDP-L-fucose synthase